MHRESLEEKEENVGLYRPCPETVWLCVCGCQTEHASGSADMSLRKSLGLGGGQVWGRVPALLLPGLVASVG